MVRCNYPSNISSPQVKQRHQAPACADRHVQAAVIKPQRCELLPAAACCCCCIQGAQAVPLA